MSICVTTGFRNIGRGDWKLFYRSEKKYFEGFTKLVRHCPYPIVAYLEEKERQMVSSATPFLKILPLEDVDALTYSHTEKDWEVMNSPTYKILMNGCHHKGEHPERCQKGYNMITSSKTNMLVHTKKVCPNFDFYAWQDFGDANLNDGIPQKIHPDILDKDRITVKGMCFDPTTKLKIDPVGYARIGGAAYICSAQFIVPSHLVEKLDTLMREQIDFNHSIGITDDDQSVMSVVINKNPDLFDWVKSCGKQDWFTLYDRLTER